MTITVPVYCTREDVKNALDVKLPASQDQQVDRTVVAASRFLEGLLHRRFYPVTATRFFDWPTGAAPWRLWLDDSELISLTSLSSGGAAIAPGDVFLEPNRTGPPYRQIQINIGTDASFGGGDSHQRDITVTGLWGYSNDESPAGTVTSGIGSSVTTLAVSSAVAIGVGQILRIGTERLLVTDRAMASTGQTLQTPLTNMKNNESVAVTNGAAFAVGEVILLDAERMLITDIAGNNLVVERSWDGSTLAAHAGSTIYASRSLTVTRGALGTIAAAIAQDAPIYRWEPPGPVRALAVGEAVTTLLQESSGYARSTGVGTATRQVGGGTVAKTVYGVGLDALREQVYTSHGRKGRVRSV